MPSKIKFPLTKLSLKNLSEFRPDLGVIEERVKEYQYRSEMPNRSEMPKLHLTSLSLFQ